MSRGDEAGMEPQSVVLLILILAVAGGTAIGLWRIAARQPSVTAGEIETRLSVTERRLLEELSRARSNSERGLLDATQKTLQAQRDFGMQVISELERVRSDTQTAIADRFQTVQRDLSAVLDASRRDVDERLSKVDDAVTRLGASVSSATGELRLSLADATRAQVEQQSQSAAELRERMGQDFTDLSRRLTDSQKDARSDQLNSGEAQRKALDELREAQARKLGELQDALVRRLTEMGEQQQAALMSLQGRVDTQLAEMRRDNEGKLEKIRATVEEKLQATLETRLGESFRMVSDRLEQVYRGLGEMQTLAAGVGDLKRVLTNVRSRGTFGEVQLGALLEQVLTPDQYARNVAVNPGSGERVEFAVKLPGRDGEKSVVWLPIDAKFPQEDYLRLQAAYEGGDAAGIEEAAKALRRRILGEAETIRTKYIVPPATTDFAILFCATEGLYAEVLRIPGLGEELQRTHRVIPSGPTTLYALLNSLQMGFKTLAIERRSSEVWQILAAVKTEFSKFGDSLEAVSKKLEEASNKMTDTTRRSRAVERKLRAVEALPDERIAELLPGLDGQGEEEEPNTEGKDRKADESVGELWEFGREPQP
jgi:DNA recombination protein RmuC